MAGRATTFLLASRMAQSDLPKVIAPPRREFGVPGMPNTIAPLPLLTKSTAPPALRVTVLPAVAANVIDAAPDVAAITDAPDVAVTLLVCWVNAAAFPIS